MGGTAGVVRNSVKVESTGGGVAWYVLRSFIVCAEHDVHVWVCVRVLLFHIFGLSRGWGVKRR